VLIVASAERNLAASTANIGIVTAIVILICSVSAFLDLYQPAGLSLNVIQQAWQLPPRRVLLGG